MNRLNISMEAGVVIPLYYPTIEDAQEHYLAATIKEINNDSYMEYINRMLDVADGHKTVERKGSIVHMLRFNTSAGICFAWLFQDNTDGVFYDFCEHQLWKSGAVVMPVTKSLSNPAEFCKEFLFPKSEYTVLCYGGKNISKPAALKGIRKFASVPYGESQYKCQLFLDRDNLYIKHTDYFSPSFCTEKIDKYTHLPEQAVYICHAWLMISNFVPMLKHLSNVETAVAVWSMIRSFHCWKYDEQNEEWKQFLEAVVSATRKYLNERGV